MLQGKAACCLRKTTKISCGYSNFFFRMPAMILSARKMASRRFMSSYEERPDIVFMDLSLPILNGLEATERLRNARFLKPIIALTASPSKGDRQRALQAGCTDYLLKPIDMSRLLAVTHEFYVREVSCCPMKGSLKFKKLKRDYRESLGSKRIGLEECWQAVHTKAWSSRIVEQAQAVRPSFSRIGRTLWVRSHFRRIQQA